MGFFSLPHLKKAFYAAVLVLVAIIFLPSSRAGAEYGRTPPTTIDPEVLRIKEGDFLGVRINGDYLLTDDTGRDFRLKDLISRPLVLLLSYYRCDGVCPTTNKNLMTMVSGLKRAVPGKDFNILTLSFDKFDGIEMIKMFKKDTGIAPREAGWKVAVFKDKEDIKKLTAEAGFKFFWSPRDRVFIHPNVYIVLSPEGRVTRYLYGANTDAGDLEVAIAEANFGTVGRSKVEDIGDLLLVACYSYNFKEGKYTLNYPLFVGAGALLIGLSFMFISIIVYRKKERR